MTNCCVKVEGRTRFSWRGTGLLLVSCLVFFFSHPLESASSESLHNWLPPVSQKSESGYSEVLKALLKWNIRQVVSSEKSTKHKTCTFCLSGCKLLAGLLSSAAWVVSFTSFTKQLRPQSTQFAPVLLMPLNNNYWIIFGVRFHLRSWLRGSVMCCVRATEWE